MAAGATTSSSPPCPVFKQPQPVNPNSLPFFSRMSEDILVNVFARLEQDPCDLARLASVCRRFKNVIRTSCWRHLCMRTVPKVVSELMSPQQRNRGLLGEPPGGWGSLQKVVVCCPGLRHAGVLLESWDFGLERELGRSEEYYVFKPPSETPQGVDSVLSSELSSAAGKDQGLKRKKMKDSGEEDTRTEGPIKHMKKGGLHYHNKVMQDQRIVSSYRRNEPPGHDNHQRTTESPGEKPCEEAIGDGESGCSDTRSHLAKGSWALTREQGNKLLASRLTSLISSFRQIFVRM